MIYALVIDDVIDNMVVWDGETSFDPGGELINQKDLPEGASIGWTRVDGVWSSPNEGQS